MDDKNMIFVVGEEHDDMRLDIFLSEISEYTRSSIQKWIRSDLIKVDDKIITKSSTHIKSGSKIELNIPKPVTWSVKPENIPLDIVHEDNDILVVDKPKDMVVHPSAGHSSHTLVNAIMYHCGTNLSAIGGVLRPGIVHRIDKDTTGLLVIAKNDRAHMALSKLFSIHDITRIYTAIVYDNLTTKGGIIDTYIGRHPVDRKKMAVVDEDKGKRAITHYKVTDHLDNKYNLIECRLKTGRTHQIRVHMASIKHPILGDNVYGRMSEKRFKHLIGQTLHAGVLGFVHPGTNQYVEYNSPLPQYFVDVLNIIKKDYS